METTNPQPQLNTISQILTENSELHVLTLEFLCWPDKENTACNRVRKYLELN